MIANLWISFLAGLFAPLGAVCVLPLYPGFLAYLSHKISPEDENSKKRVIMFGVIVTVGVILSMFVFGLIFTQLLQASLTNAISIISPIAFGLLAVISLLLIFKVDFSRFLPKANAPILQNPYWSALLFGLFFGAIVLPCNPGSLAVLFAVSTSTVSFISNLFNFILFGVGMAVPLLAFAVVSAASGNKMMRWLTKHTRAINLTAGIIMLLISLYYLLFVFRILG
jgi:cytochrome c-type biogenesis protein